MKVVLFGYGKMGQNHIKAINLVENAKIVGIVDPMAEKDQIKSDLGENVELYASDTELFAAQKPDVVHIVTPPNTHYQLAINALQNGANVYVEKPFTLNEEECTYITNFAEKQKLMVCAGHQLLFQKPVKQAEELLDNIGDIIHFESYFSFRTARKSITNVDQLIDILPHPVYVLIHFLLKAQKEKKKAKVLLDSLFTSVEGETRALLKCNEVTGQLTVSLNTRPVDSFLKITGTNGYLKIDFVRDIVIKISGSGVDAVSAILHPYRDALQKIWRSTISFAQFALNKNKNYPGLNELIHTFYDNIKTKKEPPISYESINETVKVCSIVTKELKDKESINEKKFKIKFDESEQSIALKLKNKDKILVTGGTGFLGYEVAKKLVSGGYSVVVVARSIPPLVNRIPGVNYIKGNLSKELDNEIFKGLNTIIHCAAETAGGKDEHQKNSIDATKLLIESSLKAGIKKFIHISSIAVLKPSQMSGTQLDEDSPVDFDNIGRGPYVWGKAESEGIVDQYKNNKDISIKILRPGPLVDFDKYQPPGRLGREVGTRFIVMGGKKSNLYVCNVHTVADIILYYINDFDDAPEILNIIEPDSSTRKNLMDRFLTNREDLKPFYIPTTFVNIISTILIGLQKIISPSKKPMDIASAFGSEPYNTSLIKDVIEKSKTIKN